METSYKEKYEQAIERLKQWDREHPCAGYVLSDRDKFIFPELAESESEDEKIRKRLITDFGTIGKKEWGGLEVKDILSWLERQGDYANFRDKAQVGDRITKNEDGVLVNLSQLKRVAKPADKIEPKFKVGDKIYLKPEYRMPDDDTPIANTVKEIKRIDDKHYRFDGSYIFIEDQDKYELVEQKPEGNKGNICGISPNSAWSEEDEQHIDSLLKRLDALCRNKFERTRFAISEDRDWLKSLRPQNRWKPSELQLGCLSDAIEHYNSLGYPAPKLKELLDDLKKLKEGNV